MIAEERATDPFLRVHDTSICTAVESHEGRALDSPAGVFAELRAWKDSF